MYTKETTLYFNRFILIINVYQIHPCYYQKFKNDKGT